MCLVSLTMWTKCFLLDGGISEFSLMPVCSGKQGLHHRSCEPRQTNRCFSCTTWNTTKGNNTMQQLRFLFCLLLKARRKNYKHWVSRRQRHTHECAFKHCHFLAGPCHIQSSERWMGNRFRPVDLAFPSFHASLCGVRNFLRT